jgi:hypothetical protein
MSNHTTSIFRKVKPKRKAVTDKERMTYLSERYGFDNMERKSCVIFFRGRPGSLRQAIDAAIRASRARRKESK